MPYISSTKRWAMKRGFDKGCKRGLQKGRAEGLQQGHEQGLVEAITIALESRFGAVGKRLVRRIQAIQDFEELRSLARLVMTAGSLDEVRRALPT